MMSSFHRCRDSFCLRCRPHTVMMPPSQPPSAMTHQTSALAQQMRCHPLSHRAADERKSVLQMLIADKMQPEPTSRCGCRLSWRAFAIEAACCRLVCASLHVRRQIVSSRNPGRLPHHTWHNASEQLSWGQSLWFCEQNSLNAWLEITFVLSNFPSPQPAAWRTASSAN